MKFYELLVGIVLKKDVSFKNLPEEMSKSMNMMFLGKENLKSLHKENKVKLYSYSGFYPTEKDGTYKRGLEYAFKIRFMEKDIAMDFEDFLYDVKNPLFETLRVTSTTRSLEQNIKTIKTLTPAVITIEKKNWILNTQEIDFVKDRILKNTNRKFNSLFGTQEPIHDFIEGVEVLNKCSYFFKYKSGTIIGNKFNLIIKEDFKSQELAKLVLGAGLLEKNGLGFGFCIENQEEFL